MFDGTRHSRKRRTARSARALPSCSRDVARRRRRASICEGIPLLTCRSPLNAGARGHARAQDVLNFCLYRTAIIAPLSSRCGCPLGPQSSPPKYVYFRNTFRLFQGDFMRRHPFPPGRRSTLDGTAALAIPRRNALAPRRYPKAWACRHKLSGGARWDCARRRRFVLWKRRKNLSLWTSPKIGCGDGVPRNRDCQGRR